MRYERPKINVECPKCKQITWPEKIGLGSNNANVHHIKPTRFGGEASNDNLAVLCGVCHKRVHSFYEAYAQAECLRLNPDFFHIAYKKFIEEA